MNGPISKLARCAIYTRKSTEYNLELAFNSLDAQREACEAYIKSQAHEGWRLIPGRYDDGAFSGASLERAALQRLLADVRASKIDIVLVYKVDRLTRSLADFAKLIELFDAHGVSLVSVTQSFNTSSSMGRLTTGRTIGGGRFGVGALAHLLKNRFYIGGVVYRGEVHRGEHEPILDPTLFEAVQAKLAAQAVARRRRLPGSPAFLTGRLFDDRGNRMSPTHTNKGGARYRYYVSQAVLQRKPLAAGAIGRVPAAEIEVLISAALRRHLQANGTDVLGGDRELVERHVERVTLSRKHIHLQLRQIDDAAVQTDADEDASRPVSEQLHGTVNVTIPWTSTVQAAAKGIIHVPAHNTPMTPSRRDALLIAIAKARNW